MKRLLAIYFVYLLTLSPNHSIAQPQDTIKLLVVTGGPSLSHHLRLVPTSFYTLFEGYDNLIWDHATSDEAAFGENACANYDVILLYNRSDSLSQESQNNLRTYLESGKGLIVLHHALGSYNNWQWWWKEVVGGKYQMNTTRKLTKSGFKQGETFSLKAFSNHPITAQTGDFSVVDETYSNLTILSENTVLYETNNPTSDRPLVWISPYKNSRVLVIQPGHFARTHLNKSFRKLIYNSILWVDDQ